MNAFGMASLSLLTAHDAKRTVVRPRLCDADEPLACEWAQAMRRLEREACGGRRSRACSDDKWRACLRD